MNNKNFYIIIFLIILLLVGLSIFIYFQINSEETKCIKDPISYINSEIENYGECSCFYFNQVKKLDKQTLIP
jgi:hypothetical protein